MQGFCKPKNASDSEIVGKDTKDTPQFMHDLSQCNFVTYYFPS